MLNMQMSGTNHLGGSLWHQHFFSVTIYAPLFTVSFFVVFLLQLLPIALALMKTINLLVKWPTYLGYLNKNYFKNSQNNKRLLYKGFGGMYSLNTCLVNKNYSN